MKINTMKKTLEDGKNSHVRGWGVLVLLNGQRTENYAEIQRNPCQNTNDSFHRTGENTPQIHMETQKITKEPK
jgi:hypothetical protein